MVDEDRAGLHAVERAGLAQRHGAQIVVIADASEHDIGALGRRARRRRGGGGEFLRETLGLGGGAVIDRHRMARAREMAGDGITHHPKADECDGLSRGHAPQPPVVLMWRTIGCVPAGRSMMKS